MAKSMRSKKEKRLRAIRRELVQPFYDKKDVAKLAAQEAALAAPKLPVKPSPFSSSMDVTSTLTTPAADLTVNSNIDVEMGDDSKTKNSLKPIGKKLKKKFKLAKNKRRKEKNKRRF